MNNPCRFRDTGLITIVEHHLEKVANSSVCFMFQEVKIEVTSKKNLLIFPMNFRESFIKNFNTFVIISLTRMSINHSY